MVYKCRAGLCDLALRHLGSHHRAALSIHCSLEINSSKAWPCVKLQTRDLEQVLSEMREIRRAGREVN